MKTMFKLMILAAAAVGTLTTNVLAGPGLQYWKTLV
jgi:hypothetical protein